MNTTIFLDINRFAERTIWAHGVLRLAAGTVGLVVLGVLVLCTALRARSRRMSAAGALAAVLWALAATAVAVGVGEAIGHLLDRVRPYATLRGIEVLVARSSGFSLPDLHAAAAAAVVAALWLTGDRIVASVATIVALLVAFAGIYVGAHYPGDELAGLGLGVAVALAGYPLVRLTDSALSRRRLPSLTADLAALARSGGVVGVGGAAAAVAGPAAQPIPIAGTGSVRLLEAPAAGGEVGTLPPPVRRSTPRAAPGVAAQGTVAIFPVPPRPVDGD